MGSAPWPLPGVQVIFVDEALAIHNIEEDRATVSSKSNWRYSLDWARSDRHLFTARAYLASSCTRSPPRLPIRGNGGHFPCCCWNPCAMARARPSTTRSFWPCGCCRAAAAAACAIGCAGGPRFARWCSQYEDPSIDQAVSSGQGGMESVVEGLSGALQQKGHTVQVATLRLIFSSGAMAPAESVEAGLLVRRMRHWGPRRYPVAPAALTFIRGYDLVHIHAIDFFVDYLSLLRLLHRVPMVVSTHGGFFIPSGLGPEKNVFQDRYPQVSKRSGSGGLCKPA